MSTLADRFETAAVRAPLASPQRQELDRLLAEVEAFDDLPGWWQAALLAAEQDRPAAGGHGHCCGHH
jgi:hypothetical protein